MLSNRKRNGKVKLLNHVLNGYRKFKEKKKNRNNEFKEIDFYSTGKLTTELRKDMCIHIRNGVPINRACFLVGVHPRTHYKWIRKGNEFITSMEDNGEANPTLEKYAQYLMAIKRSETLFLNRMISRSLLPDSFKVTWVRDMTILERRDKDNWGKQLDVEISEEEFNPDESFL